MSKTTDRRHLDSTTTTAINWKATHMHLLTTAIATAITLATTAANRLTPQRARRPADERGSLSLEQIIWTVALAVVALIVTAIVVAAINSKAAELPL